MNVQYDVTVNAHFMKDHKQIWLNVCLAMSEKFYIKI